MIQIFLFIGGLIAIIKGEFRATKTRNVSEKAARIIGIIFIFSALLPLLPRVRVISVRVPLLPQVVPGPLIPHPYGMIVMLAIALITAIVGVITAKKSALDKKGDNKELM